MHSANNNILLGDILRNFKNLEENMEKLKYEFDPRKLLFKTPVELNEFNTRMVATKDTVNWFCKKLQQVG